MNDWFARRITAPAPTPEMMSRRSKAVQVALNQFGCRDRAMRFLNQPDPSNGIRPIDLAARDQTGLQTVLDRLNGASPGR